MNRVPNPEDLRAFAHRRWDLVEREKFAFLADRYREGGPIAARAAAQRLQRRFAAMPTRGSLSERRDNDIAAHLILKGKLDRTRDVLRRR